MTQRRTALGLALLTSALSVASAAQAQLAVQWDAPPGCPGRDEVLGRLRALAGSSLDKTEGLSANGKITSVDGRFSLTLLVQDGSDVRKRVITSESCADLAGAAAVTLALLLGIDVRSAELPADDEQGAAPPKEAAPDERERSAQGTDEENREERKEHGPEGRGERRPERGRDPSGIAESSGAASKRRWAGVLRAPVAAASLGPLPDPTFGAGLGVGVRYESWRVVFAGFLSTGQTLSGPAEGGTSGAELERMTGELSICRGWRSLPFEIAPCVGMALERVNARGFGDGVLPHEQTAIWPAPSAGAAAYWYPLESLAFFATVNGYLELARPHLVIEGLGEVAQLAPAAVGATVGLEWIF